MKPEKPLVSVIVCVYNAGQYLRSSLLSVLNQTYQNLEILIVDDGSTDGCMETIKDLTDLRIRMLCQTNMGKPVALNRGIENARGEFYAVHDADDLSDPRRIEKQLALMQANRDVAAVFCGHDLVIHDRRMAPVSTGKDRARCKADIRACRMPGHDPTAMYRMSLVESLRYEPSLPIVEGFDYVLRVGECFGMMVLGECLYGYRIHPDSVTHRDPIRRHRLVEQVLLRACERRGLDPVMEFPHVFGERATESPQADNNLPAHFMQSVCDLNGLGRRWKAFQTGVRCASLRPTNLNYYKALAYSLMPLPLLAKIRGSRRKADMEIVSDTQPSAQRI